MVKLSIVVPLYKSERYLPKCLDSLLQQDLPLDEYEIILVNDGSPDHSKEIAEEYASKYPNILVLSQENKGASGARNYGLKEASGEFIRFVDPDDFIPPHSLNGFVRQMEEQQLDMLRFNYIVVDENYNEIDKLLSASRVNYDSEVMSGASFLEQRLGFACYIWTFVFRTSVIKDNGIYFYEGDYYDDTPWTPRVCLASKRVNSVDVVGYYYYQSPGSILRSASPAIFKRKIEGQRFLIGDLKRQSEGLKEGEGLMWYKGMLAHCVVTLLMLVAEHDFLHRREICKGLREMKLFPLSDYQAMPKTKRKIRLANRSPRLFVLLMHLKRSL